MTLFAPNSSAFAAIAPLTANGTNNATTILAGRAVLGGSVRSSLHCCAVGLTPGQIYSPELAGDDGGSVTSVSGQRLTIISNATGTSCPALSYSSGDDADAATKGSSSRPGESSQRSFSQT